MLIGRDRELAALVDACRTAAFGRGSTIVVAGEPGIGKTALLAMLGTADPDWRILRATGAEAESAVAFATLQGLLWPLREELDGLESGQTALLRGLLNLGPPGGASTFAIGAATLSLLSTASRERTVVAIVDDAHWADVASQEVLAFVGRRLEGERIVLLAGVRKNNANLLADERSFERLELGGLDTAAARSLLERSAAEGLAPDVQDRLIQACAGNPLGLVELPELLNEAQRRGHEPLPPALEAGPLVQRAFAARLIELSDHARDALLLLAAAGESEPALQAMNQAGRAGLAEAEAAGLVARGGRMDFRHPLMRAAVYGAATPTARREAHRQLASVTESARRAWHLAEAADGPDETVAEALEEAAAEARLVGGVAAEAQALERAADLSPEPDRRARRLLRAAQAWRLAGDRERTDDLVLQALPLADAARTRAEIQLERGYNLLRDREYPEAYDLLVAEARRIEQPEPDLAARLYAAVSLVANVYPEAPPALTFAERAIELAGRSGDNTELEALFAAVSARMSRPLPPDEEDERLVFRAAELLEQRALRTGEQPHWIAYALAELEHAEQGRSLSDVALAEARTAGDVWSLCYGLYARAASELVGGRVDLARSWAAEALQLAEQIGERWRLDQARVVRAEVEAARGNLAECEAFARQTSPQPGSVDRELYLGRALLATGRPDEAVPHLETAARAMSEGRPRGWYRFVPLDLAEAYVGAGRPRDAEALLREEAPAIERCRLVRPRADLARVRALLAAEAKIDSSFGQARALLDEAPHRLERARVELCWGERLRRAGRAVDASSHLEHALARFEALGAVGWAERARGELESATGSPRAAQPRRTDVLTAQELRVSRHAASGLRDRAIAAALYLSPRTVESYLQNAYRKLGVSNRTQLAGVLAADGVRPLASGGEPMP
jgi:DNA-binding CsgD family transcriptional regulator